MLSQLIVSFKKNWFSNPYKDLLAGALIALALIPESIAFALIAGVDPKVALYTSFSMTVVISFFGGRRAMISAATAAMALVLVSLVKNHGQNYLFAATILAGFLQIIAGFCKFTRLMRFISSSVISGFLNALAILIFLAQIPQFTHALGIQMYWMVALGLGFIYLLPLLNKAIPSPLIAIIVLTILSLVFKLDLRVAGDLGEFPKTIPFFKWISIPINLKSLWIILPYSLTLTVVGLLESLMVAQIVDEATETTSSKDQECKGQGIANVVTGFLGGMAGCGMVGLTMINIKSGARSRLSTLFAGVFLLFIILVLRKWVQEIPVAALVAVMIMVSISTFHWSSVKKIFVNSKRATLVIIATVVVIVSTRNLAIGVLAGVLLELAIHCKKGPPHVS